jgi:hypothetical protein
MMYVSFPAPPLSVSPAAAVVTVVRVMTRLSMLTPSLVAFIAVVTKRIAAFAANGPVRVWV